MDELFGCFIKPSVGRDVKLVIPFLDVACLVGIFRHLSLMYKKSLVLKIWELCYQLALD